MPASLTLLPPDELARIAQTVELARVRLVAGTFDAPGAYAFAGLSGLLKMRVDRRISTMATDGTHLFYNPEGCSQRTLDELRWTWAHEILHCVAGHMWRKPPWCDWHEWNVCTDLGINVALYDLGSAVGTMPANVLFDPQYRGMAAEQIAHARRKAREQAQPPPPPPQPDDDETDETDSEPDETEPEPDETDETETDETDDSDDGDSSDTDSADNGDSDETDETDSDAGQDGDSDSDSDAETDSGETEGQGGESDSDSESSAPSEPGQGGDSGSTGQASEPSDQFAGDDGSLDWGDDCLPPQTATETAEQDARANGQAPEPTLGPQEWAEAFEQAQRMATNAGEMPGALARYVAQARETSVDWRDLTMAFVEKHVASKVTWLRPSRRSEGAGVYLPGREGRNCPPLAVLVDCSGSVTDVQLGMFQTQIQALMTEVRPRALYVVYHDTQVSWYDVWTEQDGPIKLESHGGGGTMFQPALDWLARAISDGTFEQPSGILWLTDCDAWDDYAEPSVPVAFIRPPGSSVRPKFGVWADLTYV